MDKEDKAHEQAMMDWHAKQTTDTHVHETLESSVDDPGCSERQFQRMVL